MAGQGGRGIDDRQLEDIRRLVRKSREREQRGGEEEDPQAAEFAANRARAHELQDPVERRLREYVAAAEGNLALHRPAAAVSGVTGYTLRWKEERALELMLDRNNGMVEWAWTSANGTTRAKAVPATEFDPSTDLHRLVTDLCDDELWERGRMPPVL